MKQIILSAIFFLGIAGSVSAQTPKVSKNTHPASNPKPRTATIQSAPSSVPADNRTEYTVNGQKATATGHEATAVNGQHASKRKTPPRRTKGKD